MQEGGQVPRSRVARSGYLEMNCRCSSQDKVTTPSSAASSVKGCLGAHTAGLVARMECNLQWNMLSTRLWARWLWCYCRRPVSFRAGPGESVPCPSRQSPPLGRNAHSTGPRNHIQSSTWQNLPGCVGESWVCVPVESGRRTPKHPPYQHSWGSGSAGCRGPTCPHTPWAAREWVQRSAG